MSMACVFTLSAFDRVTDNVCLQSIKSVSNSTLLYLLSVSCEYGYRNLAVWPLAGLLFCNTIVRHVKLDYGSVSSRKSNTLTQCWFVSNICIAHFRALRGLPSQGNVPYFLSMKASQIKVFFALIAVAERAEHSLRWLVPQPSVLVTWSPWLKLLPWQGSRHFL